MMGTSGLFLRNSAFILGLILGLLLGMNAANAEGFIMGNEIPERYNPDSIEYFDNPGFTVGLYRYIDSANDEIPITGFLVKEKFYFIEEEIASCFGDIHYGLTDRYLIMDGFAYGASHNRTMHLLGYSDESIWLYDTIHQAFIGGNSMDFQSARKGANVYGFIDNPDPILWTEIEDEDGDGRLEIKVGISTLGYLAFPNFELYFEIDNDRLKVDLNPSLYKKLYDAITKSREKPPAYYVYGVLAGIFDLDKIRVEARNNRDLSIFVTLLEKRNEWDSAFHEFSGDKPQLTIFNPRHRR